MLPASLWILRVRHWRCYGAAFLWGASFHAIQTGNVTMPLLLLTALAWRARDALVRAGVSAGLAIATKLICGRFSSGSLSRDGCRRCASSPSSSPAPWLASGECWDSRACSTTPRASTSSSRRKRARLYYDALLVDPGAPRLGQGRVVWLVLVCRRLRLARSSRSDRLSFSFAVLPAVIASPSSGSTHSSSCSPRGSAARVLFRVGGPGPAVVRLRKRERATVADALVLGVAAATFALAVLRPADGGA